MMCTRLLVTVTLKNERIHVEKGDHGVDENSWYILRKNNRCEYNINNYYVKFSRGLLIIQEGWEIMSFVEIKS